MPRNLQEGPISLWLVVESGLIRVKEICGQRGFQGCRCFGNLFHSFLTQTPDVTEEGTDVQLLAGDPFQDVPLELGFHLIDSISCIGYATSVRRRIHGIHGTAA